jgi:guanine deaminase
MILRGEIINPQNSKKYNFYKDGGLFISNGKVKDIGNFVSIKRKYKDEKIIETDGTILPGFCDVHLHWVQNRVKGNFSGNELLPWLKKYIWKEEAKFKDKKYTEKMLEIFYKELDTNGIKHGMIYSSVHEHAAEMAIEEGIKCGDFFIGNVLMNQNSPKDLQIDTDEEIKIVEKLAKKYGRYYVVTPRFAPTCSMKLMKKIAEIAKKYGCLIQTHLAENKDEIAWVEELFPEQKSYTEIYEEAGLLGKKTILGHAIHLSDKEFKILKKTGTAIAHCPTSNIALNSGRMMVEKLIKYKIPYALGTDIGAGPSLSMLDVMQTYIKVHNDARKEQLIRGLNKDELEIPEITFEDALYRATLAGAEIMGIDKFTGNLNKGKNADFIIVKLL